MKSYNEISKSVLSRRDEYDERQRIKRKRQKTFLSVAATFVIVAVLGVGISQRDEIIRNIRPLTQVNQTQPTAPLETTAPLVTEMPTTVPTIPDAPLTTVPDIITEIQSEHACFVSPKWDELTTSEKFREFSLGEIIYGSKVQEISEEKVGEFLTEVTIEGYDIHEDKIHTEKGSVYKIKNISEKCALAVKIGDEEKYYVFTDSRYTPATLGGFIRDLDLKNTVVFEEAYIDTYEYSKTKSVHNRRTYENFSDKVIWDMLLSDESAKNIDYNKPYDRIAVKTNLPLLGYKDISFCVTPDGYIITNILDTQKCFFIGADKAAAFADYLQNNVKYEDKSEVYHYNSDGSIPGKGDAVTVATTQDSLPQMPE